jgi:hypothetical protein
MQYTFQLNNNSIKIVQNKTHNVAEAPYNYQLQAINKHDLPIDENKT